MKLSTAAQIYLITLSTHRVDVNTSKLNDQINFYFQLREKHRNAPAVRYQLKTQRNTRSGLSGDFVGFLHGQCRHGEHPQRHSS